MKSKVKWRGKFVFNRESYTEYAYAYTKKQAWLVMCKRIAKKQGVIPSMVTAYFDGTKDNFEIKEEP